MLFERSLDPRLITHKQELETVMLTARKRGAFDHDAHALVAAHRIYGDTRQTHGAFSETRQSILGFNRNDFTAVVVAAGRAQVVRTLQFAAISTFMECIDLQRVMAAAHAPAGGSRLSFRDSHFGTCSCKYVSVKKAAGDRLGTRRLAKARL
jgi:hypothetical protein